MTIYRNIDFSPRRFLTRTQAFVNGISIFAQNPKFGAPACAKPRLPKPCTAGRGFGEGPMRILREIGTEENFLEDPQLFLLVLDRLWFQIYFVSYLS
jgi:hypothetical protein